MLSSLIPPQHTPDWKPPRGAGERILYLDFDGVLHHENCLWSPKRGPYLAAPPGHILFQHAEMLAELLAPYPAWKIVLSTSWVIQYGCERAAKRLPDLLRRRVIGATFHSSMNLNEFQSMSRGLQIWADVQRRLPKQWIALDDQGFNWPAWCRENLIQTDDVLGLRTPAVLTRLNEILST